MCAVGLLVSHRRLHGTRTERPGCSGQRVDPRVARISARDAPAYLRGRPLLHRQALPALPALVEPTKRAAERSTTRLHKAVAALSTAGDPQPALLQQLRQRHRPDRRPHHATKRRRANHAREHPGPLLLLQLRERWRTQDACPAQLSKWPARSYPSHSGAVVTFGGDAWVHAWRSGSR